MELHFSTVGKDKVLNALPIEYKPAIYNSTENKVQMILSEQFKGKIQQDIKWNTDVGEEHPFKFEDTEGLYKTYGVVTGIVDKYVDFIIGPGFYVESDNKKAETIIKEFIKNINIDTVLRKWVKEALIKGTGFIELAGNNTISEIKVLDSKWMFIKRDGFGNILEYNQVAITARNRQNSFSKKETITFKEKEIACLAFNQIGDCAYGLGIVAPAMLIVNNNIGLDKSMHQMVERKANSPLHAKIGDKEHMPAPDSIQAFGKELETLTNKTEWATDYLVDLKVIDFGNVTDKFSEAFRHDEDMMFFTFQVPEVLMGRGNTNEGIAKVQMDAFERRIQSFQEEIEKIIEEKIFKRVLASAGIDAQVEIVWGQPNEEQTNKKIITINEILKNSLLSMNNRDLLEKELMKLLGFEEQELESEEVKKEKEMEKKVPIIPAENRYEHIYWGSVADEN